MSDDGERVHNHAPYRPACSERMTPGGLRGACLNDDGTDRMAPDADERVVAALAEAVCGDSPCAACEQKAEALAPTVARLIEDAVAERLAGVEALCAAEVRRIDAINATPDPLTGRHSTIRPFLFVDDIRAALRTEGNSRDSDSEPTSVPLAADQPSEAPGGREGASVRLEAAALLLSQVSIDRKLSGYWRARQDERGDLDVVQGYLESLRDWLRGAGQ